MLDSRYIHLHEALGLGPMWLRSHVRLLRPPPPAENAAGHTPAAGAESAAHTPDTVSAARLAVLQRLGGIHYADKPTRDETVRQHTAETAPAEAVQAAQAVQAGQPSAAVQLMALSVCAAPDDITAGRLFSGADGELLAKMFAAIRLQPQDVRLGTWLPGLPDFNPRPPQQEVAAATERVAAELQQCRARVLLLMGSFFERDDVLAEVQRLNCPYFIIPHPKRILGDSRLKRGAWETLQAIRAALDAAA